KGAEAIRGRLRKSVEKGTMTEEAAQASLARLRPAADLAELSDADLVIEAIYEDASAKTALYRQLEQTVSATTIIGTNTSSLSVTELSAALERPDRFLGLHFFNPPTKLALVEVITTPDFPADQTQTVTALLQRCGKQPVVVKDSPGFIVNRLLLPLINEAARLVDAGIAAPADIDAAMRLGALHPAGPLQVADLIGLDICCDILEKLSASLNKPEFRPAAALTSRVASGKLGRKTGAGFYTY
ncbi:MAG: 3-hydroxyacyl-CoA dehydrogenase family protein, partial [Lentisphaeria bacterium]|nr:3-hydroxyacyl-CoA dehydrogenase family protein [Lentisphaeria bacterium]